MSDFVYRGLAAMRRGERSLCVVFGGDCGRVRAKVDRFGLGEIMKEIYSITRK